jgi:hypothetical protein
MFLPDWVLARRAAYVAKFPLWTMPAGAAAEERAREWSIGFAEQIMWETSVAASRWGMKRADPTRPISKDTIARQIAASLFAWDNLSGAGSGSPVLVDNPDSMDITGQFFEVRPEYITPQDHLGATVPPEPPVPPVPPDPPVPPTPTPCPCDEALHRIETLAQLTLARVDALNARVAELEQSLNTSHVTLAMLIQDIPTEYVGAASIRVLGPAPIVLRGKDKR